LTAKDIIKGGQQIRTQLVICNTATSDGGQTLLNYYTSHQARGQLPRRSDMPCRELLGIMPDLFMLEPVDAAGDDWRFRLVGQRLVEQVGVDATGLCISQAYEGADAERNAGDYRDVAMNGNTRITCGTFHGIDREFLQMEIVHVPMIGANGETPWVLGGLFIQRAPCST
ncbi:MAG: PAS domain-containing protein, partial [Pseudomonadota bacterium]